MISELGRRLASDFEPTSRERIDPADGGRPRPAADGASGDPIGTTRRSIPANGEEDPDFALSLSSASLLLAEGGAEIPAPDAPRHSNPTGFPDPADSLTAPSARATSSDPARPGPANRAIDAYRETARAPVGERIRIAV